MRMSERKEERMERDVYREKRKRERERQRQREGEGAQLLEKTLVILPLHLGKPYL